MPLRMTGMMSGMDTESIIQELVAAKRKKVDTKTKEKTKHEWQQDAWKDLNSKLKNFQSKYLSNMRFSSSYSKKKSKVSNSSAVSVITGENAMNGVQTMKIRQLAKTAYQTGGKVQLASGEGEVDALTKVSDLKGFSAGGFYDLMVGGVKKTFEITEDTTISDVLNDLKSAGLNANFDAKQQRLFVSAKESGAANDFAFAATGDAWNALNSLGLTMSASTKVSGQDAIIELNGATFTNNSNTFEINGLTITALSETNEDITITTEQDTDGIYDMVKNFLKEYNSLVNEMDKLYNAASSKGYDPLLDDEKEKMSDSEIEKWEKKIKDSILRRDENLSTINSSLQTIMASGFEINGRTMYLDDFGIGTLGYFNAADNEKHAYHIDGDADDEYTSGNADKLKSMIANDPDTVIAFFTKMSQELYGKMSDMSKSVKDYRTFGSFYDDKKMKSDQTEYEKKIKQMEQKVADYEDSWYRKFSKMETALAKMQSNVNAVTSLFGGGGS